METRLTRGGPDLTPIERADLQPSTKWQYKKAILNMTQAGIDPRNHEALQGYAATLKQSSRQFLRSALRLMTSELKQRLLATSDGSAQVIAGLHRLEAMQNVIHVQAPAGEKAHVWLSREQVTELTALCERSTIEGRRDWVVLGLLLGAGLRREELAELTFEGLKTQPTKNGQPRHILQVTGKGAKTRVIPISAVLAGHLKEWQKEVGAGFVARSKARGHLGESLSPVGIFQLVNRYGVRIGLTGLAPHDLRRTYAQLGYEAGISITQISKLLGHSSVATTQRYLNLSLDLENTASDHIPLSGD